MIEFPVEHLISGKLPLSEPLHISLVRIFQRMEGVTLLKVVTFEKSILPFVDNYFKQLCVAHRVPIPNPWKPYFYYFATCYLKTINRPLKKWEQDLMILKMSSIAGNNDNLPGGYSTTLVNNSSQLIISSDGDSSTQKKKHATVSTDSYPINPNPTNLKEVSVQMAKNLSKVREIKLKQPQPRFSAKLSKYRRMSAHN
ncbi:hypothetical protein CRE_05929 [Caenorhabditis remanei]|uniref:Uncharacterized protein n=1 Tax=Caenorhabditis remanei TaxID=31234 RepID=E3MZC2_CAERE|nr:hypothetical protein CRE_05929 [Caenorhabditis remanei]